MVLRQVWGDTYGDEAEYLRVYIYRLRKKLGERAALCCGPRPASAIAFQPAEGARRPVPHFFYSARRRFTSCSRRRAQPERMADFLAVLGIVAFAWRCSALIKGLERV